MIQNKIKYGICVDNNDPYNADRIRVVIDKEESSKFKSNSNIDTIMAEIDSENQGNYVKWEIASGKFKTDPYVVNPFLPKHINIVPKKGESVKLLVFENSEGTSYVEYIGPDISNKNKVGYEYYESGRGFTSERLTKAPKVEFDKVDLFRNKDQVGLIGRNNSDLILGDNLASIRAGYRTESGVRKSNNYSLLNVKKFPIKRETVKRNRTIDTTPTAIINYVVEYAISTDENGLINMNLIMYPTDTLLNTTIYSDTEDYYSEMPQSEIIEITIESNNVGKIINLLNRILTGFDNNRMVIQEGSYEETNLKYVIIDNRPPVNGFIQQGEVSFMVSLYAFRSTPTQNIQDNNYLTISGALPNTLRPINKVPTPETVIEEVEELRNIENTSDSLIYALTNIILLLSSKTDTTLNNQVNDYELNQAKLNKIIKETTQPMVRGKTLASILLRILNIMELHGHSTDGPNTLSENVKDELKSLKNELSTILDDDLENSSDLVNENVRIN